MSPASIRRRSSGYTGFPVATGRLVFAALALVFVLVQTLRGQMPQGWIWTFIIAGFGVFSAIQWWQTGRRVHAATLRPSGRLELDAVLGKRELEAAELDWAKVYPDGVVLQHAGERIELRGIENNVGPFADALARVEDLKLDDRRS